MSNQRFANRLFLVLVFLACLLTAAMSFAQSKPKDSANTVKITGTHVKDTTIRNVQYPLYRGAKGGMYIIRTSKTGKQYKQYFKKQ